MKNGLKITIVAGCVLMLVSCNIYKPFTSPETPQVDQLYRDTLTEGVLSASDTINFGALPWQEVFTDASLQQLIEQGLTNNVNLLSALSRVEQAQAMLRASQLAFLPSLGLAPQGTLSSVDNSAYSKTYNLPVQASWEIDLFGSLRNAKRGQKAALLQSEAYAQAVRSQLIATVANSYYTLLMLDNQLQISRETVTIWQKNVEVMRKLKTVGMSNEAGIAQSEANCFMVMASLSNLERQIRETENALSVLLGEAPGHIVRGELSDQVLPMRISAGVPVQMLSNRPDVKAAEMGVAQAYYATNKARSDLYPKLVLSGSAGWTNSLGGAIVNPGELIVSFVGGLTAPIFNRGASRARLKVAKAQQEDAALEFQQSLLEAGAEVSNALFLYTTAGEKSTQHAAQAESLVRALGYTQELYRAGQASYLEILTAQQSLLSAQLNVVSDRYERLQSVVNLYQALGGGR